MVWSKTVCCLFLQVSVHLLSEKEKNDMAQLVNTMVSCCITYKNLKFDPLPNTSRHDAVSDTSMLSFDHPIGDLINFKGVADRVCLSLLPTSEGSWVTIARALSIFHTWKHCSGALMRKLIKHSQPLKSGWSSGENE
ncbi:hypothetical protein LOK49_LG01G02328 [Camellia lanceoleosa]|uniref:Uncharacterized protein n=1 Tax=Camellia lanceoleosa TaxID=1840588 RepID=A0ACC0IWG1_9ERIC|nr:hypothetical protein LOK49_LG01G02328 [Camellia lanceoleosa]